MSNSFAVFLLALNLCSGSPSSRTATSTSYAPVSTAPNLDPRATALSLLNAVRAAEANATNNKISLRGIEPYPIEECLVSGATAKHAFIGSNVTLSCIPATTQNARIIWYYDRRLLFATSGSGQRPLLFATSSFGSTLFEHSTKGHTSLLRIINVTFALSGQFECLERNQTTNELNLRETFYLQLEPRGVGDIFQYPLEMTVLQTRRSFSCTCSVRFHCEDPDSHFIWKYKGVFAVVPERHFINRQILEYLPEQRQTVGHAATNCSENGDPHPYCSHTVTITWPQDHSGGTIECWATLDLLPDNIWFIKTKEIAL